MCVILPIISLLGSSLNFSIIKFYWKSKARIVPLVYIVLSSIHLAISLLALLQMITFASFPSFIYPKGKPEMEFTENVFMVGHVLGFEMLHRLAVMVNCTMSVMRSIGICFPFYRIQKSLFRTAVFIYTLCLIALLLFFVISDFLREEETDIKYLKPPKPIEGRLLNMSSILIKNRIPDIIGFTIPPISVNHLCMVINQCVLGARVEFMHGLYYVLPFVIPVSITSISFVVSLVGMYVQVNRVEVPHFTSLHFTTPHFTSTSSDLSSVESTVLFTTNIA